MLCSNISPKSDAKAGSLFLSANWRPAVGTQSAAVARKLRRKHAQPNANTPVHIRFFNKVVAESLLTCWLWTGCTDDCGYGKFNHGGECLAHRVSWLLSIGSIPPNSYLLHSCDTPHCVNPFHLFPGTQKLNMEDSARKGRRNYRHGEDVNTAVLTEDQVQFIREYYIKAMTGLTVKGTQRKQPICGTIPFLANKFGVEAQTIWSVAVGRTWKR